MESHFLAIRGRCFTYTPIKPVSRDAVRDSYFIQLKIPDATKYGISDTEDMSWAIVLTEPNEPYLDWGYFNSVVIMSLNVNERIDVALNIREYRVISKIDNPCNPDPTYHKTTVISL